MNTVEVLKAAKAKIEQGWCQRRSAKNQYGIEVGVTDPAASSWCTMGAIRAVTVHPYYAVEAVSKMCGDTSVFEWNDHPDRTQAEVLAMFDKAIDQ